MKRFLLSLFALSMLISATCQEKANVKLEEKAIIALLENETDAWLKGDYERWSNSYLQDESNIRLDVGSSHCDLQYGWNEINSYLKGYFNNEAGMPLIGIKTDYHIKVFGNAAWVVHNESFKHVDTGEDVGFTVTASKILEKVNGEWKIAGMTTIQTNTYKEPEGSATE